MNKNITSIKKTYIAISDHHAIRIKAYTRPKAITKAAIIFIQSIKGWKPEHGGIVDKSNSKEIRTYLNEHKDVEWINEGRPIDA